ncbi:MAG: methylmalonyl-CoA decarboxylase [Desulfobacca sp.]|nr:methylmalonyl-CoA decarboxylase [Desulfobacca sp.]
MTLILTEVQEHIATITLNNPAKRNALSKALVTEVIAAFARFRNHKARVVILRAPAGAQVWSAGADITEFPQPGEDPLPYYGHIERLIRAIQHSPAPVIAMIEGSVWGGACELALVCDILIGTDTTSFAITPAKIGVPYNPGGILHFINMVGMALVKEMFFTAQPITAQRALAVGLLNHLVPAADLESFTYRMAQGITRNSPLSISVIKEQLRLLGNALPLSPETFERIQGLREKVYHSKDFLEGQQAFLQKRPPEFIGE